jgi:hypothetical protein
MPGTVLEKHASSITLPERNGWWASTPVSTTAIVVPVPSYPAAQAWSPWTIGTLSASTGLTISSSNTRTTSGELSNAARVAGVISRATMGTV